MLQLCLQTGLRLGDVVSLELPDLELAHNPPHLKIRSGKGGIPGIAYLNHDGANAFDEGRALSGGQGRPWLEAALAGLP